MAGEIFIEAKEDNKPDTAKTVSIAEENSIIKTAENISKNPVLNTIDIDSTLDVTSTALDSVEMNVSCTEENTVEMNIPSNVPKSVGSDIPSTGTKTLEMADDKLSFTKQGVIKNQNFEEETSKDENAKEGFMKQDNESDLIEDANTNSDASSEFDVGSDIDDTNAPLEEEEIVANDIIKSKHEHEIVVEPINVEIPLDAVLKCVGTVLYRVENIIVVQQHDSGEEKVLDLDSILLYEDRKIIGRISDTFGPVTQPLYSIHFSSIEEATEMFRKDSPVLYVPNLVHILMTRPLKTKGTDASNLWDEEVGEHEIEFSDDEKETEFKRRRKQGDSNRKKMKQGPIPPFNPTPRPIKRNVKNNPVPPESLYNSHVPNLNPPLGMVYPNLNLFPPMQLDFNQLQQLQQFHLQQMQQVQMQSYSQQQSIQQLSGLLQQLQRQQQEDDNK